jgi:hypothetical protein
MGAMTDWLLEQTERENQLCICCFKRPRKWPCRVCDEPIICQQCYEEYGQNLCADCEHWLHDD